MAEAAGQGRNVSRSERSPGGMLGEDPTREPRSEPRYWNALAWIEEFGGQETHDRDDSDAAGSSERAG